MSITFERDGSVTLRGDADPTRTRVVPASTSRADRDAAIAAFVAVEPRPVPAKVTNYQARQALIDAGRFEEADAKVRASGSTSAVQAWDFANEFFRASPFIGLIGAALGMTQTQIDDLFRAAELVP